MKLENYIRTVKDFPEKGIKFQDIGPMLENPQVRQQSYQEMAGLLEDEVRSLDSVAGFGARGFLFGPGIADELDAPFYMIRKEGKLPGETRSESYGLEYDQDTVEIQEGLIDDGERVALVDDVLATGGTMEAGANLVERSGGKVYSCAALMEINSLDGRERLGEQGYDVRTVMSR
jgi:adenine phosphoribosyltransferase